MDGGPRDAGAAGARPWPEGFRAAVGWLIEKITQHGEIWLAPMSEIADRVTAATAAAPGPGCANMPPSQKGSNPRH
jgi:hypothetical protein